MLQYVSKLIQKEGGGFVKELYIPENAKKIIERLEACGHEAYIVGGCVRDALLGKIPNDYDITTSATPEKTKAIFEKTVDTGIAHGTVVVVLGGEAYEVTTYRVDGEYLDSRHPVSVSFTSRLTDDLARRDFTVNAMAYSPSRGIVDANGGIADLNARRIRTVGDPTERFSEDALRILRGIRFSSVLDFDIEENTASAIKALASTLSHVSEERIYVEWSKLLSGKRAYRVIKEYRNVIEVFLPELKGVELIDELAFYSLPPRLRAIALFAPLGAEAFVRAMKRLKTDSKTMSFGKAVLSSLIHSDTVDEKNLREYLVRCEDSVAKAAALISEELGYCPAGTYLCISELIDMDIPRRLDMLAINGNKLIELGYSGKMIGNILAALLHGVAVGELENNERELIEYTVREIKNGI